MTSNAREMWVLVIAATALTGWWLSLRNGASFRGVQASMSFLIVTLAVLLSILAISGQANPNHLRRAHAGGAAALEAAAGGFNRLAPADGVSAPDAP
jgi:hypothetical protein